MAAGPTDGSGGGGGGAAGGLAREAEEQIKLADRDERLTNSACFLSPETCQTGDPADKALQDEIANLVKGTLELRPGVERKERVLVTTLTKKMAEDLTDFLLENGLKVRYLHSEADTVSPIHM